MIFDWRSALRLGRPKNAGFDRLGTASQLALRLDRQLGNEERACTLFIAGADDDMAGAEACAELALSLADEYGRSVLMVDATFGTQGIGSLLRDGAGPGLSELLDGDHVSAEQIAGAVLPTTHDLVSCLPAGDHIGGRIASASAKRLRGFLEAAGSSVDFVLVQGANVLAGGRSLAFAALCDANLVVVLEGRTRVERIEMARDILLDCGAKRVGLILAE
jgi:Mrp family chromosome partitioning ATPase